MKTPWTRLIRFVDPTGHIHTGEPILPDPNFDLGTHSPDGNSPLHARVITGPDIFTSCVVTNETAQVQKILSPLAQSDIPIIRCIGLNYSTHIREAGRQPPPYPSMFFKPATSILDPGCPIIVPKIAQDSQADYEGELCIIIGRDAKDVSASEAHEYIAGYTCGNDVSARKLQRDPALAGRVPQWGFSKGFDTFAPLGPVLVSADVIGDPKTLHLTTRLDGTVVQSAGVDDLLFDCARIVAYLSQGTTLQKGTVIMTGTPGGVGSSLDPPRYLTPGTVVEVNISGIGTLRNGVEFA